MAPRSFAAAICAALYFGAVISPVSALADYKTTELALLDQQIAAKSADLVAMKKQREALLAKPVASKPKPVSSSTDAAFALAGFREFQQQLLRENSDYKLEKPLFAKPPRGDPCDPQRLFIRADSLDNYLYGITPSSKAVGASISYLNDRVLDTQTFSAKGMVSYVILRDICPVTPAGDLPYISGYAVAPFVQGGGNLTFPRSAKETSSLKTGFEAQVEVSRGFPLRQVFTFAPYYLTDYRGEARANGLNGYWDFYDANLHLGGYVNSSPILEWYVQLRGEADVRDVNVAGVTNLDRGRYAWLGGTARIFFFLFPSWTGIDTVLRNRISFVGEASWFDDVRSNRQLRKYVATAKYNLSESDNSSIQLQYTRGTDKDTLVNLNQIMLKLAYAY